MSVCTGITFGKPYLHPLGGSIQIVAMLTPFHVVKTFYSETEISRDRTIETPNFPMNSLMLAFPAWCEHPHGRIAINSQSFFSRNFFLRADFHCFLLSISFFNLESFMLLSPYLVMERDPLDPLPFFAGNITT